MQYSRGAAWPLPAAYSDGHRRKYVAGFCHSKMATGDHGPVGTLSRRTVGFSDALDWRPLLFVEPVIAERACALCGVLCRKAVRLWCAHTVCSDCYAECVERGGTCPLDQEPFCEDDLDRLECSAGYIMKRRVACWNLPSGCNFIGPVSSLLDHFKQCTFHTVSCPQCSCSVVRSNIVRHCKEGCSIAPTMDTVANISLNPDHGSIEQARNELKESLGKISVDLTFLQSSLNQCSEDIRATGTSCKDLLEDQFSKLNDLNALITAGFTEKQQALQIVDANVVAALVTAGTSNRDLIVKELHAQSDQLIASTYASCKQLLEDQANRFGDLTALCTAGFSEEQRALQRVVADVETTVSTNRNIMTKELREQSNQLMPARGGMSQKQICISTEMTCRWDFGDWASRKAVGGSQYGSGSFESTSCKNSGDIDVICDVRIYPDGSDREVDWPFNKSLVFGINHPTDGSKSITNKIGAYGNKRSSLKPLCTVKELDEGMFVSFNTLQLFLQVLS
ncbi:uncharacterized protein LOC121832934 [Ixodes scapularis]|uniref:uncharacterized protein LOC121832934 n=1 Tax=Ixodes scapularis TaxID=6945 RepID=UPI001C37E9D3|nr:uncharacterized protein LOC121832934 [Ixodes scapularis]